MVLGVRITTNGGNNIEVVMKRGPAFLEAYTVDKGLQTMSNTARSMGPER
jgi:hypothetical protein